MGSISILEADNEEELKVLYKKALINIKNTYLKYEAQEDIQKAIIIQEKIVGQEYGLDIINDLNGIYQNTIVKKKIAMRSGETDCAVVVNDEKLQKLGKDISKDMKHIGNMDVDIFLVDDEPYVLEMNARFGGGYPFSHLSGINLPYAIIKWLDGEKVEKKCFIPKKTDVYIHKDIQIIELDKIYKENKK